MFNKKPNFGTGKGIIPFPVGLVTNAKLAGYVLAPIAAEKGNKRLLAFLTEANELQDETAQADLFAANSQFDSMCYAAAVIEVKGAMVQTIDIGFDTNGSPIKVVSRDYKAADGSTKAGKAYELATAKELKEYEAAQLETA